MNARHSGSETPAPVFYSALLAAIERGRGAPRSGSAAQWCGWLDGAQRRGEFKQAERDWLGLDDWLAQQKGSIQRDALREFVTANQVQVQDVVLGAKPAPTTDDLVASAMSAFGREYPAASPENREAAEATAREWAQGDIGRRDAGRIMGIDPESLGDIRQRGDSEAKFASYQLPGGENYGEMLLTLPTPEAPAAPAINTAGWTAEIRGGTDESPTWLVQGANGEPHGFAHGQTEADAIASAAASESRMAPINAVRLASFKSSHFAQLNILVHIRYNERTDADGKRVLFLEEIQSDWHQQGRKRGYGRYLPWSVFNENEGSAVAAFTTQHEADADAIERGGRDAGFFVAGTGAFTFAGISGASTVPDAPFKSTDEWAMLAFKRMVRWAAEKGFDSIGWTTGAQQAERYDLSKQVIQIRVIPGAANSSIPVGVRRVIITKSDGTDIDLKVGSDGTVSAGPFNAGLNGKALDEVVGKDVAERIMATEKEAALRGDGLKVGGAGMRSFYDIILPNTVNKWAKKFDGEVVEDLVIVDRASKDARDRFAPVHILVLTDAMRVAAMGGLPLFKRQKAESPAPEVEEDDDRPALRF